MGAVYPRGCGGERVDESDKLAELYDGDGEFLGLRDDISGPMDLEVRISTAWARIYTR